MKNNNPINTTPTSPDQNKGKNKSFKVQIDREIYEFETENITGKDILIKAGKTPVEQYRLDQRLHGGATKKVGLEDLVNLTTPGVERFMTLRLDQTEGEQ